MRLALTTVAKAPSVFGVLFHSILHLLVEAGWNFKAQYVDGDPTKEEIYYGLLKLT
jgi:hypothetical protein